MSQSSFVRILALTSIIALIPTHSLALSVSSSSSTSSKTYTRAANDSRAQRKAQTRKSRVDIKKLSEFNKSQKENKKKQIEASKQNWGKSFSSKTSRASVSSATASSVQTSWPVDSKVTLMIINFLAPTDENIEVLKSNMEYYNDASHHSWYLMMRDDLFMIKQNAAKLAYYQKQSETRGLTPAELAEVKALMADINKSIETLNEMMK
jgi:hypothetical protein